jgi:hypothetical protein
MGPQQSGKQFEVLFDKLALMRGFYPIRIPNGFQITQQFPLKGFLIKSPFDYILEHNDHGIAFLDLKTIATKKFPTALIKPHQIKILDRLGSKNVAGFLVWYRKVDLVVFFTAKHASLSANLCMADGLAIGKLHDMDLVKLMISGNKSPDNKSSGCPD